MIVVVVVVVVVERVRMIRIRAGSRRSGEKVRRRRRVEHVVRRGMMMVRQRGC